MRVGVLALQGAFVEHQASIGQLGYDCIQVKKPIDLVEITHLILPGGESTAIGFLLDKTGLFEPIKHKVLIGELALFGTCAGAILMAQTVLDPYEGQKSLGLMNMQIRRNAFGRQVASFEISVDLIDVGQSISAVFIRAPIIESVGAKVQVMGWMEGGGIIAAREGRCLVSMFHPELTPDLRLHQYFLGL